MLSLLVTLIVIGLVAYLAERAMPQYYQAIRLLAVVLVLFVLLRFGGLF